MLQRGKAKIQVMSSSKNRRNTFRHGKRVVGLGFVWMFAVRTVVRGESGGDWNVFHMVSVLGVYGAAKPDKSELLPESILFPHLHWGSEQIGDSKWAVADMALSAQGSSFTAPHPILFCFQKTIHLHEQGFPYKGSNHFLFPKLLYPLMCLLPPVK